MDDTSDGRERFAPIVVVPTFDHAVQLSGVLDGIARLGLPCIVVDDGSSDGTESLLDSWRAAHMRKDYIVRRHDRNRGKAAALETGFEEARHRNHTHAVTIDADGQLETADIPALLAASRADPTALVLGTRPEFIPGRPTRCLVGRRHAGLAVFAQTGRRLADTQCGLRVYPLELLGSVRCRSGRFAFESEIITRSIWQGREVVEVPVSCSYAAADERVSHFRPYSDSIRQGVMHVGLLVRALLPWSRTQRVTEAAGASSNRLRQIANWLNPLQCWRDIRSSDTQSLEFAIAIGLGAWIGTLPFFGIHTALALYVSWRFHLRPSAMVLGSQVSVPPFGAVLAVISFTVGHTLLTGTTPSLGGVEFGWASLASATWHFGVSWLIGSIIVGFAIGLTLFGVLQFVLPWFRATAPTESKQNHTSVPVVAPDGDQSSPAEA